tara:strand:- start:2818 stop:3867 length:1050 start_codon:yes stop_codon:yes gene_type:complete
MGFLDNSGDIILDAVLTDAGRKRLAAGDGSFRISKFALGDDEINYSLYTPVTSSGYQDLRILQLPILEAFTNNTSVLKNKLLTYADNSLLYLPVIKLNSEGLVGNVTAASATPAFAGYYASVDATTVTETTSEAAGLLGRSPGFLFIDDASAIHLVQSSMVFDQGLDTSELSLNYLSSNQRNLVETQYIIEVDNRLLQLRTTAGDLSIATPTFIDDDSVASYYFSLNSNPGYFAAQPGGAGPTIEAGAPGISYTITDPGGVNAASSGKVIGGTTTTGRLGTRLVFGLRATLDTQTTTTLFTQLGGEISVTIDAVPKIFYYVDTIVRVTGFTTGYRTDVPLRLLKWKSTP